MYFSIAHFSEEKMTQKKTGAVTLAVFTSIYTQTNSLNFMMVILAPS